MRIITGTAKGQKLFSGKKTDTRPTQDRVKEAIFNMLGSFVIECRGLDLFAGFGGLGLEALSRGAKHFTFVEHNKANCKIIKKNINLCGFKDRSKVIKDDVNNFLEKNNEKWDLIFMDPPYEKENILSILNSILKNEIIAEKGIIVVEHSKRQQISCPDRLNVIKERTYGDSGIHILGLKEEKNEN